MENLLSPFMNVLHVIFLPVLCINTALTPSDERALSSPCSVLTRALEVSLAAASACCPYSCRTTS